MSNVALKIIQQGLFDALHADSILNDVITGIYDHLPPTAQHPCVVIGDGKELDIANDHALASRLEVTLYAYSKAQGRKEILTILERLHALLHHGSLPLSAGNLVHMRVGSMETRVHKASGYMEGVLQLIVLVAHDGGAHV
jgi:hypothetical protein